MKKRLFAGCFAALLALLPVTAARAEATKPGWTDDAIAALKTAEAEKKMLLMDFTGSDWCSVCLEMNRNVFNTAEFKEYARANLILLELDFPKKRAIKLETLQQNEELRQLFGVEGLPTLIVLDITGKPVKAFLGVPDGPKPFIAELKKLKG